MNKYKLYIYIMAAAAMLAACSSDEPGYGPVAGGVSVRITDGGYASPTKAQEEGLATLFEEGDKVGLFAVLNGEVMPEVNNLCLTAATADGNVIWGNPAGVAEISGATYYAYYPYRETLPAEVNPAATDSREFFRNVTAAWEVAEDQTDYANYTASDLMTASSELVASHLDLRLSHEMALVRVALPVGGYKFTNTPEIPDYMYKRVDGSEFTGFKPCEINGYYHYLLRPADESRNFAGSYVDNGSTRRWSFDVTPVAGEANTYNIDGGASMTEHLLQVGDYLLSDGSLLSKDVSADKVKKSDVVGVIYNIDPRRIGQAEKNALGGVAHASVLCALQLTDPFGGALSWSANKKDETEIGLTMTFGSTLAQSYEMADADISGYGIMEKIKEGRVSDYASKVYEAFYYAELFGKDNANYDRLKSVTTGWYLPSLGQWYDIVRNLGGASLQTDADHMKGAPDVYYFAEQGTVLSNINAWMANIADGAKTDLDINRWYWTASSTSTDYAFYVNCTDSNAVGTHSMNSFSCFANSKTSYNYLRLVLTF